MLPIPSFILRRFRKPHRAGAEASAAAALLAATAAALAGTLACCFAPARPAQAQATTYSTTRRSYKVGVLLLDSTIDFNVDGNISQQEASRGPENPDPYVFFIADARNDIKPANWELINPHAPATVTPDIKARWDARDPNHPYQIGQKVEKNMAAYWEVHLSQATEEQLLEYDLLFITHHRDTKLTPQENEKLRKVVDSGGVVWIEDCGNMRIRPDGPLFLNNLQFRAEGSAANAGPVINAPNHPILNSPFVLSFQEVANLGDKNYSNYYLGQMIPADRTNPGVPVPRNNSSRGLAAPHPGILVNVVGNGAALDDGGNALPYIAAGNYGSGAIVATAGDSGCDINDYAGGVNVGSGGNSGAFCGPNRETAHVEDLKFVYNLISWGSANTTYRRNNRRLGSSSESIGAPLLPKFDFTKPGTAAAAIVDSQTAPLIVNGILYVTGIAEGRNVLRAYDTRPYSDLDQDGNPDDGRQDLALGAPFDELWRADLGAASAVQPSAPVYASVFSVNPANPTERIFVTLPDGTLAVADAVNKEPAGLRRILPVNTTIAFNPAAGITGGGEYPRNVPGTPPVAVAPAVQEGRAYVVEPDGLIRCVDAQNPNTTYWTSFSGSSPPDPPIAPLGPPTIGYVRQRSELSPSGMASFSYGATLDLMLYLPYRETAGQNAAGGVLAYWLGARNEVIKTAESVTGISPPGSIFKARAANAANKGKYYIADYGTHITPRVRVFQNEYDPANPGQVIRTREENYIAGTESTVYTGQFIPDPASGSRDGFVQVLDSGSNAPRPNDVLVAVDYDVLYLDPNKPALPNLTGTGARNVQPLRAVNYPSGAGSNALSALALTPDDLLVYSLDERNADGSATFASIFGMLEQYQPGPALPGAGQPSRLSWRYLFFPSYVATVEDREVREDAPLRNVLTFGVNNTPYVPGEGDAVRGPAEEVANLTVHGAPIATNDNIAYVMLQGASAANGGAVVTVLAALRTNPRVELNVGPFVGTPRVSQFSPLTQGQVNLIQGTHFQANPTSGKITINNFQDPGGNNLASLAQAFVVRLRRDANAAETTIIRYPSGSGGLRDNGAGDGSDDYSPLLWYYVLPGRPLSSPTMIGEHIYYIAETPAPGGTDRRVVAVNADPASIDPQVKVGAGQQVLSVTRRIGTNPVAMQDNKVNHVTWSDQVLSNPLAGGSPFATAPPTGAQGILAVNSQFGTFAYEDSVTLITDAKRIIEARADGSAVWTLDSTVRYQQVGGPLPVYIPQNPGDPVLDPDPNTFTGRVVAERKPLTRPNFARRLSNSEYMIADTGNNRVVRVDRTGQVLWELDRLADPYNVLSSGDPTTLNEPTDVAMYIQRNANGYEVHYLVADTGNYRIIEVANYFDANGRAVDAPGQGGTAGQNVVVWSTRTKSAQGRNLRYQSVQILYQRDPVSGFYGVPQVAAVVGNASAAGTGSSAATDGTGGSLVILNYKPLGASFTLRDANGNIQPGYTPWPVGQGEPSGNGTIVETVDQIVFVENQGGNTVTRTKRITRPLYFEQVRDAAAPDFPYYLLCDAEGVYELQRTTVNGNPVLAVTWFFTQDDYHLINSVVPSGTPGVGAVNTSIIGRLVFPNGAATVPLANMPGFQPSSVRRLASGDYLIANSYSGRSPLFVSGRFVGEVFQITPNRTLGAGVSNRGALPKGSAAIPSFEYIFSIPDLTQSGSLNRQRMGATDDTTNLVEQPRSAQRLF